MTTHQYSLSLRATSLVVAIAVSVTSLLGFSLLVDLKPAQALFGIDAAIQIAFEFVKALAKQFVLRFIMRFVIKLLQKLESIHVIRNFLAYADALGLDQYVGKALDKAFGADKADLDKLCKANPKDSRCKALTSGGTTTDDPSDTNAVSIAIKHELNPVSAFTEKQLEELAQRSRQDANDDIKDVSFTAYPTQIKAGQTANLFWNVNFAASNLDSFYSYDIKAFSQKDASDRVVINSNPGSEGNMDTIPKTTTVYEFNVYRKTSFGQGVSDLKNLVAQQTVTIEVDGAPVPTFDPQQGPNINQFGLTKADEKKLLRGAIATLVTAPFCPNSYSYKSIRNVAIYEAAKARGPKPDPKSKSYFRDSFVSRNPLASPDFQEFLLRDTAGSAQAESQRAVQQELTSSGQKALRGSGTNPNGISSTSQTIADKIQIQLEKAFNVNQDTSNTAFIGRIIGQVFADMIVNAIFKEKGRVVGESVICASAKLATSEVYKGGTDTKDVNKDAKNTNALLTVNGQAAVTVKSGEAVTVQWDVANHEGTIEVLPPPSPACRNNIERGSCTFNATQDVTFQLRATTSEAGFTLATASVLIDKTTSFNAEFDVSPLSITAGKDVSLSWTVTEGNYTARLNGSNVALVESRTERPGSTTTYTFEVFDDSAGGKRVYVKAVTVEVKAGP